MSASSHIARAKKHGVDFERFPDREILERDGYVCGECGKQCDRSKRAPHPDAPTLGHIIALSCGGTHTRDNCHCECADCNFRLNNERDTKLAAKIKRRRLETGQQARRAKRKAEGKAPLIQGRSKLESRGFDKSLKKHMNGKVSRRG